MIANGRFRQWAVGLRSRSGRSPARATLERRQDAIVVQDGTLSIYDGSVEPRRNQLGMLDDPASLP
jgi:hypothetical protein